MGSKRRKFGKGLIIAMGTPVLLVAVLLFLLHLPPVLQKVARFGEEQASAALDGELTIENLEGSVFGSLKASNLTLVGADGQRVVSARSVTITPALLALLTRTVSLDIEAEGLVAYLERREDGSLNLTDLFRKEEESSGPSPVALEIAIEAGSGTVLWRDLSSEKESDPLAELGAEYEVNDLRDAVKAVPTPENIARAAPHSAALYGIELDMEVEVARESRTQIRVNELRGDAAVPGITATRELVIRGVDVLIEEDRTSGIVESAKIVDWMELDRFEGWVSLVDASRFAAHVDRLMVTDDAAVRLLPDAQMRTGATIELHVTGEKEGTTIWTNLSPNGSKGTLTLAGELQNWAPPSSKTHYDLVLLAENFEPSKLTSLAEPVHRVSLWGELTGTGVDPYGLDATLSLAVRGLMVDEYTVSAAYLEGKATQGTWEVSRGVVLSPYISSAFSGHLTENGIFAVSARAKSTDAVAGVAKRLLGRTLDTRADVTLDANGELDLSAEAPLDIVKKLAATARWDVDQFSMEDVGIARSDGKLDVTVSPTSGRRNVTWDVAASAVSVRSANNRLDSATLKSNGSTTIGASSLDARQVLGDLRTTLDLDVQGLDAMGTTASRANVLAKVRPRSGRLDYEIKASADALQTSFLAANAVGTALRGDVKLGPTLDWPGAVKALSVKGDASATGIRSGSEGAGQITARVDIGGNINDLRGTVDTAAQDLALGGYEFREITANVAFTGDQNFTVDAQGTQKEAKPEQIGITMRGRYAKDLTDYTILDFALTTVGPGWEMQGELRADVGKGVFEFRDVTLTRESPEGGTQKISVNGTFRTGRDQDLVAELDNVHLGDLAEQFGLAALEPLKGTVGGTVELGGTHAKPTAGFEIRVVGLMWEEWGPFDVFAKGRYGELSLVLEKLEVDGYEARLLEASAELPVRLTAGGDVEFLRRSAVVLDAEIPEMPLSVLSRPVPQLAEYNLTGDIVGTVKVRGAVETPVLQAKFEGKKIESKGTTSGTPYEFGPAHATVEVGYVPTRRTDSGLEAKASLQFQKEQPFEARVRVDAPIADWLRESFEGATFDWMKRLESAPLEFSARASQFDLRNLRVGPLQRADVEGLVDLDVTGSGIVSRPTASIAVSLGDFGWNRYRDIYLDVEATIDRSAAVVKRIALEWDGDDILFARGRLPAPLALATGTADLPTLPLDFEVQLRTLPLKKFSAVDYTFAALKGDVSGFVRLDGTMSKPEVSGRFSAVDFEFMNKARGTIAAEVKAVDDRVVADLLFCEGSTGSLAGHASVPVDLDFAKRLQSDDPVKTLLDGEIEGYVRGNDVPLGSLLPRRVFDDVVSDVGGKMDIDLALAGTIAAPKVSGALQVQNGQVYLADYSRLFRDIQVDLDISDQGLVKLDRFYLSDARGFAKAEGTLQLDGFKPGEVDIEAVLDSVGTAGFADISAFVSAAIDVKGDMSGASADAKAVISKLEVVIPQVTSTDLHPTSLDEDIVVVRDKRRKSDLFEFTSAEAAAAREAYARLTIEIEPDSWIRHPYADVEIKGEMDVELRSDGAILGGEIRTIRGDAEVFGRRFVIQEGIVSFTGANPPNPLLQIEARYTYDRRVAASLGTASDGDPHAIVRVTGRASNPDIRFLSDPDLPESDVIYTLLTNRAPNDADVGQSGASDVAAGAASGLAATFLEDQLAEVVPGFNVRVEAGDEGFADPTFEVGRYIGPFFVSIEAKVGADANENAAELNVEYRLSRRWLIELEAGTRGTGETNIFWDIY